MKNLLKILFCLLFSLPVFAQEKKDSTNSKWSVAIEGSGIYTFPTFYALGTPKTDITFGSGVYGKLNILKNTCVILGSIYDFLKYEDSFSEVSITGVPFIRRDIYEYSIISLASRLNMDMGKKNLFLNVSMGLNISILTGNAHKIYQLNFYHESKLFDNGTMFISGTLNFGINYRMTNNIMFYLQPEMVQSFSPIVYTYTTTSGETYSENNYLRYLKFNSGITYYFKGH